MRMKTNKLRRLLQVCTAAAALILCGTYRVLDPGAGPTVDTDAGKIRGEVAGAVAAFKGIPFAQPPVGALRWRAPQPITWQGLRQATQFGADCMQVPLRGDSAPLAGKLSEDCLYVNLWTPVRFRSQKKLPVMVWIFGGAFVNGGTSSAVYDGSAFARDGVVLVTFNYRLGSFGFFAHPALSAEQTGGPLGNYGYMDQIAALRWVRRNAAAFGGDPDNVTVFGESAGGVSVHALLTSPLSQGLFQKAIIESGAGRANMISSVKLRGETDSAESRGLALARDFGIDGGDAGALVQLRALPAKKLLGKLNMANMGANPHYAGGPIEDGALDLGWPIALYQQDRARAVPLVIGATSLDFGWVKFRTLDDLFAPFAGDAAAARAAWAPDAKAPVSATALTVSGDLIMVEPARQAARLLSVHQPVFEYRFSYVAETQRGKTTGAPHASEIPYVFDTLAAALGRHVTQSDQAAATAIHAYWIGFARTGTPQAAGLPAWPAYQASEDKLLDFTVHGPQVQADPWKTRLDLAQRFNSSNDASH